MVLGGADPLLDGRRHDLRELVGIEDGVGLEREVARAGDLEGPGPGVRLLERGLRVRGPVVGEADLRGGDGEVEALPRDVEGISVERRGLLGRDLLDGAQGDVGPVERGSRHEVRLEVDAPRHVGAGEKDDDDGGYGPQEPAARALGRRAVGDGGDEGALGAGDKARAGGGPLGRARVGLLLHMARHAMIHPR